MNALFRRLPVPLRIGSEVGWRPAGRHHLEPDLLVFPRAFEAPTVPPAEALLLIELARSSLKYDRDVNSNSHAELGVREYWIFTVPGLTTQIYRGLDGRRYSETFKAPRRNLFSSLSVPELAVRMDEIGKE